MYHQLEKREAELTYQLISLEGELASLEAYSKVLKHGLTNQAAAFLYTDLQRFDKIYGFTSTVSVEDFAVATARSNSPTTVPLEGIGSRITAALKQFQEWIKKLFEIARQQVSHLVTSFTGLRTRLQGVQEQVKTMPDGAKMTVHLPGAIVNQLSINGKFERSDLKSIGGLAQFGAVTYPSVVEEFYAELATIIKVYVPSDGGPEEMVSAIEESTRPLHQLGESDVTFPGNMKLAISDDGLSYSVAQVDADTNGEDLELPVRSRQELEKLLGGIGAIIDVVEKIAPAEDSISAAVEKVVEAADVLSEKAQKSADQASVSNAEAVINAAMAVTRQAKPGNKSIIKYVGRVLNTHLAAIQREVETATNHQRA
jgi:hypothetical protein